MHQPDTTPRQSLYFDYEIYPAAPLPPESAERAPVVVVGAGPIGLALALDIARHGVRVVLLTAGQQVSEGSRAIVFTRRSLEILQQVGADSVLVEQGLPWRFGSSFYRGQAVFRLEAPHDPHDRYAPMNNLQQQVLEASMLSLIARQPLLELRWGHRVAALACDEQEARLTVETPDGVYTQRASWVVACDGARSSLRQLQGLQLEGESWQGRFVIADIKIDLPLPTERLAFFDPAWNPGNTVLMHREPFGIWRIDYQLPPNETPEEALQPASLAARINAQLQSIGFGDKPWTMDWCSVYSARALTLADYLQQRVIYCGDAAHLLPIFGVRGANTGFQDAQNLAWKLAAHVQGKAPLALLQSYSTERVAAAREIVAEAGKSTRFMTPPTPGFRLLRDATLSLALSQDFVRPLMHWRSSRPHEYRHSPLNSDDDDSAQFPQGPAPGAVMPSVRMAADHYLLDESHTGFTLLIFSDRPVVPEIALAAEQWRVQGGLLKIVTLPLAVANGEAWARYGVQADGAAYLVRPDQHVCARWRQLTSARLLHALARALGDATPEKTT
jgi:3-(3-hydroxy-phenyl)propionate hydroxylase